MFGGNWALWSIKHKNIVYFFAFLVLVMGLYSFNSLGRMEDPSFTVKQMVVSAAWPGATAKETEEHVTLALEKQIQNTPDIDKITSYSRPGTAVITVQIKDEVPNDKVRAHWLELRNTVNDCRDKLPEGVIGPFFNDRFDDVYGTIYALSGADYSYEELRRYAEHIKLRLFAVPDVKKVELLGVQQEKIYLEADSEKLGQFGLDIASLASLIKAQTALSPAGMLEVDGKNIYLRLSGEMSATEQLASLPLTAGGRTFRLGSLVKVRRAYSDPPDAKFYFNGKKAVGLAVSMEDGGNNIALGKNLRAAAEAARRDLPLGLELEQVADQSQVVESSIGEFSRSLWEAIVIVLVVSLFSLGRRSGYVISCSIPLILLGSFCGMYFLGIDLHKVSLGSLVLSLGMLVDDAIVVVELMEVKLSEGWERTKAASYAFATCAKPLLTGTVITCLGFAPIAFSKSNASEFASALAPVVSMTLLLSWFVSATLAPALGHSWIVPRVIKKDSFDGVFYQKFRTLLRWSLLHKAGVLGLSLALFAGSLALLPFVKKEFFPPSVRPELLVELDLPEGSSLKSSDAAASELTKLLQDDPDVKNISTYVGKSAPRFVLVIDQVQPRDNYAQLVVLAKDIEARRRLEQKVSRLAAERLPDVLTFTRSIPLGPPQPYEVMLRVRGSDAAAVKTYAQKLRQVMEQHPHITKTRLDWLEESNAAVIEIDNDKLVQMGLTRQAVASALYAQASGYTMAAYLEGDQAIPIVFRLAPEEAADLDDLASFSIPTAKGAVPLAQVARIKRGSEDTIIWRRDLLPTVTVCGAIGPEVTGNDVTEEVYEMAAELRKELPPGLTIEEGGSLEDSRKGLRKLLAPLPFIAVIIIVLLMLELKDLRKIAVIIATVPLGLVGVILGLLLCGSKLGFMAQLGILALIGTVIRNGVVLVDQIDQHLEAGQEPAQAVMEASVVRFRPIMLAAFTTVLGLAPMFPSQFWNAMAVSISFGLTCATLLTLVVLPVLYSVVFRIKLR